MNPDDATAVLPAKLKLLADAVPQFVWMATADGVINYVNQCGATYQGGSARVIRDLALAPDDLARFGRQWKQAVGAQRPFDIECRLRRADGEYRWHALRAVQVDRSVSLLPIWIGTAIDVHAGVQAKADLDAANLETTRATAELETLRAQAPENKAERMRRQLASIVENSTDGILSVGLDDVVVTCNPAAERMFGYPADEVIGRPLAILWPTLRGLRPDESYRPVTAGQTLRRETRARRKDGSLVDVFLSSSPLIDPRGGIVGQSVVLRDITERLAAQKAQRTSDRQLDEAQRIGHLGSYELDVATGGIIWTAELFEMLGLDASVVPTTQLIASAVHPDDQAAYIEAQELAASRAQHVDMTLRIVRDDGERWIHLLGVPDKAADGTVVKIVGTMQDVTDKTETDRTLLQAENRFETAFEQSGLGLGILNLDGIPVRVNSAVCVMLGRPMDVLVGRSWDEYQHPDDPTFHQTSRSHAFDSSDTYTDERRLIRPDGSAVWAILNLTLVRDSSEAPQSYLMQLQDVTELRRSDEERERTLRLASLGQLAGGVAHDFNNLLGVILTYTTLLLRRVHEPEMVADLEEIRTASESGAGLTRQLLTFARRDMATPAPIEVDDVVRSVVSMLERTIGEHIELDVDLGAEQSLTIGDRHQLEQIVMNLAINARDAMPTGGRLTISTELQGRPEREMGDGEVLPDIVLRVADDGHGMSAAVVARAFEPFFSTKPNGQGTGLGLATVYGIVHDQGGDVTITSQPGLGTTVTVILRGTTAPAHPRAVEPAAPHGGGEQILLVEDETSLRHATARILKEQGYAVVTAGDGAEALEIYRQDREAIALVLTDLSMPGMRGDELAQILAVEAGTVPIIFMSGYGVGDTPLDGRLLAKPVSEDILLTAVREALDA